MRGPSGSGSSRLGLASNGLSKQRIHNDRSGKGREMRVEITLESGEHVTGTVHTLIVDHDHSDASVRVSPIEIDAITFTDSGTTLYPNAEPLKGWMQREV